MDPGILHGLTSPRGLLPSRYARTNVERQLRRMAIDTRKRCKATWRSNTLALTIRLYGSVIASITTLTGTIVSLTAFFLISTGTSLLSWKSNSGIPFAPGSKLGLYMSLWCEEYLDRIGNTPPVKLPPTTIRQSYSPSAYIILPASLHYNPGSLVFTSPGKGN